MSSRAVSLQRSGNGIVLDLIVPVTICAMRMPHAMA